MIKDIAIIFISIFLESLPFLLLGSFISALIENYISDETFVKLIPKNKVLGSIMGICLGFFLPACDCAVIPVSKRLLKKKVPLNVAVSFMLSSPIINPVVLLSGYYAFYKTNPEMFWYRFIYGILVSFIIGIIMAIIFGKQNIIINDLNEECNCHHHQNLENKCSNHHNLLKDLINIFKTTAYDLFDIIKYLILGGIIASLFQVLLPRTILMFFSENNVLESIILMLFAYLISLCSTSDSFIGKSLLSTFSKSSILAYLLCGPMIDIKNTVVLLGNYKKSFVLALISFIFLSVFIVSLVVSL